jgi:hypothetical protein
MTPVTSADFGTKFGGDPSGTPLYHLLPVAGCYTDLAGTFIGVNSHWGVTLSALSSIEPALRLCLLDTSRAKHLPDCPALRGVSFPGRGPGKKCQNP